ncbi:metallophosphoesterase family protein [Thermoflexus sp.]|uniref:metallophosphoesterase family protein n=1 Tax=Thermoflexus sp. TaxID=1969742 RepID=UPI0025F45951|nr:exonuclease SbcCD subunit D [Thermoflexus sp.]MDW8180500.1 exonuclease SbcCD subunit D [Anaerolineae bacterium]MCS6962751.1 exonuclease SbcCD subunit D [Thermoflexus sp.]MCS7351047.1 exonuclease SbcCD subunit D [Thermoflexus sp.]MCX7690535.1 exonuclease SbcCD subunit D [Thermoflexus sp.]MDW8183987.1 exonuclease SbcCD subunit D [Anaerolineae bacterium]
MASEPIRVLHFADLHIGIEAYGQIDPQTGLNRRVVDFLQAFDRVVEHAIREEADLVLFCGDAFKNRDPSPTHLREFAARLRRLLEAGIPVFLLVGNHDLPGMEKRATPLDIFGEFRPLLRVGDHLMVGRREAVHRIRTRRGPLQLISMPFPVRARLLKDEAWRNLPAEELDHKLREALHLLLQRMLETEIDPALPTIVAGHFSIEGATYGSERQVMIGYDVVLPPSMFQHPAIDYVALGHIHKHQVVGDGSPPIVYSGSVERVDFTEEEEPKGFCWVEVRRGDAQWRFVELPARRFTTLSIDLRNASDPEMAAIAQIRRAASSVREAVVRVHVRIRPEQMEGLREARLREELEKAGAFYVSGIRIEREEISRLRIALGEVERLTPMELLERYLESRDPPPDPERRARLLRAAEQLFARGED